MLPFFDNKKNHSQTAAVIISRRGGQDFQENPELNEASLDLETKSIVEEILYNIQKSLVSELAKALIDKRENSGGEEQW